MQTTHHYMPCVITITCDTEIDSIRKKMQKVKKNFSQCDYMHEKHHPSMVFSHFYKFVILSSLKKTVCTYNCKRPKIARLCATNSKNFAGDVTPRLLFLLCSQEHSPAILRLKFYPYQHNIL